VWANGGEPSSGLRRRRLWKKIIIIIKAVENPEIAPSGLPGY
jgi:hypothetical protein